jgi:hypothetical protein
MVIDDQDVRRTLHFCKYRPMHAACFAKYVSIYGYRRA